MVRDVGVAHDYTDQRLNYCVLSCLAIDDWGVLANTPCPTRELARRRQCLSPKPSRRAHATDGLGVFLDRLGTANEIALNFVAVFVGEKSELLCRLNALSYHRQI